METEQVSTTDRREIRGREKRVGFAREQELKDLQDILDSPAGRRVLWRIMGYCGVFRSVFDGHGAKMSFNCGMQDAGHWIMDEVHKARSDAFAQMMLEHEEEKRKNG